MIRQVFGTQTNIQDGTFCKKTVNGIQRFTIFAKCSILDGWLLSEYASDSNK